MMMVWVDGLGRRWLDSGGVIGGRGKAKKNRAALVKTDERETWGEVFIEKLIILACATPGSACDSVHVRARGTVETASVHRRRAAGRLAPVLSPSLSSFLPALEPNLSQGVFACPPYSATPQVRHTIDYWLLLGLALTCGCHNFFSTKSHHNCGAHFYRRSFRRRHNWCGKVWPQAKQPLKLRTQTFQTPLNKSMVDP
jgi:hypothetical protein